MKRAIQALVVDDDKSARSILEKFLEISSMVNIVGSVNNSLSAMKIVETNRIDVIFLDINMPNEDGIEFATKLRNKNIDTNIVFTTAYTNYAASAFSIKPIDYLVKPFGLNDVFNVLIKIEKAIDLHEEAQSEEKIWGNIIPDKLKFRSLKGYVFINPNDIVYIKVTGSNTDIIMQCGKIERVFSILNEIFDDIKKFGFIRINRSVIINQNYVDRIDRKTHVCVVKCDKYEQEFPLTKSVIKHFQNINSIKLG